MRGTFAKQRRRRDFDIVRKCLRIAFEDCPKKVKRTEAKFRFSEPFKFCFSKMLHETKKTSYSFLTSFKEKITSFQYNYSTRSLFCQFLSPTVGHILGSFVEWFGWPTTNVFLQTQKFWPKVWWTCDGNNFIFFISEQFLHLLTFNELGKILRFFFP